MAILHKNISDSADIHNPKWLPDANNGDYAFKNEKGELESIDELLLPSALNFVDASVAPPTTATGDIYILSSGGSVNAGWGSVALQDWVRYDGAAWNSLTPQKSSLCYDKTADSLMSFNGTAWAAIGGGGGGGNTIYTANDTLTGARVVEQNGNNIGFKNSLNNSEITFRSDGYIVNQNMATNNFLFLSNPTGTKKFGFSVNTFEVRQDFSFFRDTTNTNTYIKFTHLRALSQWVFSNVFKHQIHGQYNSYFYGPGFSGTNQYLTIGATTRPGTESISLQGYTLIKVADTLSTSSALQIYDGDGTPNLLVDFKNNGTVNMSSLPTSSAGLASGDMYNDSGTLKIV